MASYRFYKIPFPISKHKKQYHQTTIISSQGFQDEGKWAENNGNRVDANMGVLSKRIEAERMKERLDKTAGWNYKAAGYVEKKRRRGLLSESFEIASLAGTTISIVFLSGSIFLYLFSLLIKP